MKVKTETQRQKILDAARTLFLEKGFEAVSMDDIARGMQGSKATIYNYFNGKNAIFVEVMLQSARALGGQVHAVLESSQPVHDILSMFGAQYLRFILTPQMLEIRRIAVAHADRDDIGREMYERGLKPAWQRVADFLAQASKKKVIKKGDSWTMAIQLKALLEAGLMDQYMTGVKKRINSNEIAAQVEKAIDMFWSYYAVKA